jgi:hypothetical protein
MAICLWCDEIFHGKLERNLFRYPALKHPSHPLLPAVSHREEGR